VGKGGQGGLSESYLRDDIILDVAQRVGVDAIHPGVCGWGGGGGVAEGTIEGGGKGSGIES
jgi:pyruvate carboxylase